MKALKVDVDRLVSNCSGKGDATLLNSLDVIVSLGYFVHVILGWFSLLCGLYLFLSSCIFW